MPPDYRGALVGPAVLWPDQVGLRPASPHQAAGQRIDPPVSLPIAIAHRPAATAAPEPLDEPAGSRSVFHGLRAGGNGVSKAVPPIANSQVVSLPSRITPACFNRRGAIALLRANLCEVRVETKNEGYAHYGVLR